MAAREKFVKRYVVRLSVEEREQLESLIRKGKSPAQRLLKARILLKADVSEAGDGWSDSKIIAALETSASMVYRVRKQLVEEGVEAVLSRKQRAAPAVPPIFDGEKEAKLIGPGVFQTAQGAGALDLAVAGEQSGGTQHRRSRQRQHDRSGFKKTLSSPIAANNGSSHPRPTARSWPRWRTCWPSTGGHMILTARWFAATRPRTNSSVRRACRSR